MRQGMATLSQPIFLSTLSLRRATVFVCVICQRLAISIHALLAESDNQQGVENMRLSNISIHALLAESDGGSGVGSWPLVIFLSTLSLRRATFTGSAWVPDFPISIHALLAESDMTLLRSCSVKLNFYPRSPCGERRWLRCWQLAARDISIHALLAESDDVIAEMTEAQSISIHALLAESDSHPEPAN